jgi:4-aminobutyrate aminotransferase/(S)-3-amino-2-methylpropionate transaminase
MTAKSNDQLANIRKEFISDGVAALALNFIESGRGSTLYDVEGREYIDFAGGIGAMNVGHSHPKVVAAIEEQARRLTHTCFFVNPYESGVLLAERLARSIPGDFAKKTVFLTSGAEAVENAVKIARVYTGRPAVIVFENAYHGRTLLTMTMTSKIKPYKLGFGPFAPEVYRMPFGDSAGPEELLDFFHTHVNPEAVAAVVAEPVQGEGGFIAPGPDYFGRLAEICREHGILFAADEIQSGMGRTGKMWAIEHWGVEPDLVCVGKSLAAGMPITAVIGRSEIMDAVHPGGLGGTYGGNPVSCAAGLAVLDAYEEEGILDQAAALGEKLEDRLGALQSEFDFIGALRGLGAMRGFEINEGGAPSAQRAKAVVDYCHANGLILLACGTYGNVVRILCPLVITDQELEKGLAILRRGLESVRQ